MKSPPENQKISPSQRLREIYNRLSAIPEGKGIVDFLKNNDIKVKIRKNAVSYASSFITITGIENGKYTYAPFSIVMNAELNDDNLLQALVHETQHIRHHLASAGNPDFWPSDEDHCLLRRIQEADAQTATTHIVYKLKQAGDEKPFNEVMKTDYKNMCEAYEKACETNPAAVFNGEAQRAAFDAWFKNTKTVKFYDRDTITHQTPFLKKRLYENLNKHNLKPGKLTAAWLKKIGELSGVNYMALSGHPGVTTQKYRRNIAKNITLFPGK